MSESVYILGGGRTDFKRNLKKEGKTIRHIIIEAGKRAIDDAKIDPAEIQAGAVGNFNSGQFTKQLHLGAFVPEIDPKLHGIPTIHTEAACASGSLSVLLGAQWIMGGFYDAVLVVGAEQQKTMPSIEGADALGAAADYHNEKPEYGDFMFPKLFGRIAIFLNVNLCDAPEQFRKHEIAVLRLFVVIIGSRTEHIRSIERRHCLLLFRANNEHDVIKPAHDPFG